MKIHEYQARNLLEKFGIPVPPAVVVDQAADAIGKDSLRDLCQMLLCTNEFLYVP